MQIQNTSIQDLKLIIPKIFQDERGYFMESFRDDFIFKSLNINFVQDNESQSSKNVLRGLHFQSAPHAQAKLVRVIKGAVLDIAVDLRPNLSTFKKYFKTVLSEENKHQLYIPKGFAHGFVVLKDETIVSYKCSDYYHPETEHSLLWNDPTLEIDWGIENPIISHKDNNGKPLKSLLPNLKW